MSIGVQVTGVERLRLHMEMLAMRAGRNPVLRRGMTDGARVIARAQKAMAPVRKTTRRKFRAIRKITVDNEFVRPIGPRKLIKPGLLKRSIGFRVRKNKKEGTYAVVIGANVGKRRHNNNFAPHAAFAGSGTKQRYSSGILRGNEYGPARANRGIMPPNYYIRNATAGAASAALAVIQNAIRADFMAEVARS